MKNIFRLFKEVNKKIDSKKFLDVILINYKKN